jgi:3-phosphoglycerate kinase
MLNLTQIPKQSIFNKFFFIRVNFDDTHFDLNEEIDYTRMHLAKSTIEYLSANGGKLILFNHRDYRACSGYKRTLAGN